MALPRSTHFHFPSKAGRGPGASSSDSPSSTWFCGKDVGRAGRKLRWEMVSHEHQISVLLSSLTVRALVSDLILPVSFSDLPAAVPE